MKKVTFLLLTLIVLTFTGCGVTKELMEPESGTSTMDNNNTSTSGNGTTEESLMESMDDMMDDLTDDMTGNSDANQNSAANHNGDTNENNSKSGDQALITEEKARDKALSHAGLTKEQVTFTKAGLDQEEGRKIYDIEFYDKDRKEYDYEIDALTGDVVSYDHDADDK